MAKYTTEFITPEIATHALLKMCMNRKPNQRRLKALANAMVSGYWQPETGEAIKFDTQDQLIDGQHRLLAIIEAGKLFPYFKGVEVGVFRDVPTQAMQVIDTGKSRTLGDIARISEEFKHITPSHISIFKVFCATYKAGVLTGMSRRRTCQEELELIDCYFASIDFAKTQYLAHTGRTGHLRNKYVAAAIARAHYGSSPIERDRLARFCSVLREGVGTCAEDNPACHLGNQIAKEALRGRTQSGDPSHSASTKIFGLCCQTEGAGDARDGWICEYR